MKLRVKNLTGLSKATGLIGKEKIYPIFFKTRFGIHTFGLRFPIDVLILDNNDMVVCLRKNLKTNRVFFWNPKFEKVIELPVGFIQTSGIRKGGKIDVVYSQ